MYFKSNQKAWNTIKTHDKNKKNSKIYLKKYDMPITAILKIYINNGIKNNIINNK